MYILNTETIKTQLDKMYEKFEPRDPNSEIQRSKRVKEALIAISQLHRLHPILTKFSFLAVKAILQRGKLIRIEQN